MPRRLTFIMILIVSSIICVNLAFAIQHFDVIDEVPPSSNAEERAQREAKNRLYNRGGADLTTMDPDMSVHETSCGGVQPLLPTEYTPIIMLGTVVSLQPYLSEDKSSIYTEYALHVEKYLKKDTDTLPAVDERLIVDRTGGVLRLRDGHVIRYHSSGTGMARPLHVGERLVLFLNRIHDGASLMLGRGFLLRDGKAYAIGESEGNMTLVGEIEGVEKNLSQEGEFLKAVQRAIQNPPSPAFYSALDIRQQETKQ